MENPTTCGSPGVFLASEEDSTNHGGDKKKISIRDRIIEEGAGKPNLGARRAISLKEFVFKTPKTGGSPGDFFEDQDKNTSEEALTKKKLGRDASGLRCIKFSKTPQTGGSPGNCLARQEDTSLSSPNSGKSPGEK